MASRLNFGASAAHTRMSSDEMRAQCWERNRKAKSLGWQRWGLVRETAGGWEVEELRGPHVEDIWRLIDDKPLVPVGWARDQVFREIGLARWRLERGMAADDFMCWAVEGREQRRRAFVESELQGRA